MKRFSFSLQTVHDQRAVQRETAEREFVDAARALSNAEAALEKAIFEREIAVDAYIAHLESGAVDPQQLTLHVGHIARLVERENEKRARLASFERAQEIKRKAVITTTRDEKAITNLRDRHRARHEAAAARIEQTALDEMATMSFARRVR